MADLYVWTRSKHKDLASLRRTIQRHGLPSLRVGNTIEVCYNGEWWVYMLDWDTKRVIRKRDTMFKHPDEPINAPHIYCQACGKPVQPEKTRMVRVGQNEGMQYIYDVCKECVKDGVIHGVRKRGCRAHFVD